MNWAPRKGASRKVNQLFNLSMTHHNFNKDHNFNKESQKTRRWSKSLRLRLILKTRAKVKVQTQLLKIFEYYQCEGQHFFLLWTRLEADFSYCPGLHGQRRPSMDDPSVHVNNFSAGIHRPATISKFLSNGTGLKPRKLNGPVNKSLAIHGSPFQWLLQAKWW